MIAALLNGFIGTGLSFGLAMGILDFSFWECLLCLFAANTSAFIGVLLTLQAERITRGRGRWLNNGLKAWAFLTTIYCVILLSLAPPLRAFKPFIYLFLPLLLSTGFSILVFGPVQDILVRRQQRKSLITES